MNIRKPMDSTENASNQNGKCVAVIGAGIAGLAAGRILQDRGCKIKVFEKSRGLGGRMSTRRVEDEHSFDHGAQFFTVRDKRFDDHVSSWMENGIVARWPDINGAETQPIVVLQNGHVVKVSDSVERFVGVPHMNSICKHLAGDMEVAKNTRVNQVEKVDSGVRLADDQGNELGSFDQAIFAIPSRQAVDLLSEFPSVAKPVSQISMSPSYAVMATFDDPLTQDWSGAFIHASFLTWVARNNTKPGRPTTRENVVIHAGPEWTSENWDNDSSQIAASILDEFWRATGIETRKPVDVQTHRWKFAVAPAASEGHCFSDADSGVHACGDWAAGGRVEGAFLSGLTAAENVLSAMADQA